MRGIVWLKKDLRFEDHRPLSQATHECQEVIAIYVVEDQWLQSFEFDESHLQFVLQSLISLETKLAEVGVSLLVRRGSVIDVLNEVHHQTPFERMYSHEETGVDWTYQRDIKIKKWALGRSVLWREFSQFGVVRRLKSRDLWNQARVRIIERPLWKPPLAKAKMKVYLSQDWKDWSFYGLPKSSKKELQVGGELEAKKTLDSFLSRRSVNYMKSISSPWLAREGGSRLSPYISFGNLSLSHIHRSLSLQKSKSSSGHVKNLSAFENRLWWHCHFIQKLESEPEIEYENVNRAFDGLRESEFNKTFFEAWKKGETGYPMIDASMRSLLATGWLNFRMRAMLVSFASYQLWLHWRPTAEFLARHFLDFEPGIHFSQFQMQSGVTGINTIRIYSPVKQALDQDGAVPFIRKYCPELSKVPDEYLHNPSEMPPLLRMLEDFQLGRDYPEPIVDPVQSYQQAKDKIFSWRSRPEVKSLAKQVVTKHASRRSGPGQARFPAQSREVIFGNLKKK